jgi:hypothetical protein
MTSSKMASPKQWSLPPWSVCSLLILVLLTACSTGQGSSSSTPTARPQPTQQTSPGPSPVATLLAQAPQGCPLGPSLGSKVFPQFNGSPATGSGPVWEFGLPANATLNLDQLGYTPWPGTKILWPIGPDIPDIVTVRVTNLMTGTEAWWDIGVGDPPPNQPVRPLILDGVGNRGGGPPTFGAFLYLPQAGCFAMTVSWTGGQWRLLFAVGR